MTLPQKPFKIDKQPLLDINANASDDPEIPYSGGSSAAFINDDLNKPAEKEKKKKVQQRSDLLPVATDIFTFLNEERAAVGDIRSYLTKLPPGASAVQIKDEYRARELYYGYLNRFELWMTNRLSKTPASKIKK